MLETVRSTWWTIILRGVIAVVFGFAAIAWPSLTFTTLAQVFGVFAIVDGVFAIIIAIIGREEYERWWLLMVEGLLGILAGIFAIIYTAITLAILLYIIAFRAIVTGAFGALAAWELRKEIENEWFLAINGGMSILFGVLVILFPVTSAQVIAAMIGIFAIFLGVLFIVLGWEARSGRLKHRPETRKRIRAR